MAKKKKEDLKQEEIKFENTITEKSELLFLYETKYNIPNGDPFTGEQRYDEETKKVLVSDVRIKRYVRDYLINSKGNEIYLVSGYTSATRIKSLLDKEKSKSVAKVMTSCIDVRLFGGISTMKDHTLDITGPVQFSLLNPSLNKVNLRMHQNTSNFSSKEENNQGAIGTTSVVPYSIVQIHGWINPKVAEKSGMTEEDTKSLFQGMWYGTSGDGSSHSRSKIGQNSILLIQIIYKEKNKKIYGVDQLIKLSANDNKSDEQFRSMEDFNFDFEALKNVANDEKVQEVRYYTEIKNIDSVLSEVENFVKLDI